MDEPLGALDLKLREAMQVELTRIQRSLGVTTVLVTHDQHEAMNLADRIVVMAHGRIQQVGSPDDLYRRPRTRFVAEFLGRNNILRGQLEGMQGDETIVALSSGTKIRMPACRAAEPGSAVDIAIRPEHVMLGLAPNGGGDAIVGQVEERRFLGNVVHYTVRLPAGDGLLVEQAAESPLFDPGADVRLIWQRDRAHLFDAQGNTLRDE